jgi:hypothetical protein
MRVLLFLCLVGICIVAACTKEEYLASFGATYTISAKNLEPALEGDYLVAEISYESTCRGGGSKFSYRIKDAEETGMPYSVLLVERKEPECEDADKVGSFVHVEEITLHLADDKSASLAFKAQEFRFLAFPPDGEFEIYNLKERAGTTKKEASAHGGEGVFVDEEVSVGSSSSSSSSKRNFTDESSSGAVEVGVDASSSVFDGGSGTESIE